MRILGIDEAGRGPVIGPMVIAGFCIEERDIDKLKEYGVKDSKLLSRDQREEIYEKIKNYENYYIVIDPKTIDKYVYEKRLNYLEFENMVKIINKLNPDKVLIDSPLIRTEKVEEYIKNNIENKSIKIKAEIKADRKYLVVGAASIIAKVIRDREIDKIKQKLNIDFGSGYPSDEITIKSIKENYDILKEYIRESWNTVKKIRESKQNNIFDYFMPR